MSKKMGVETTQTMDFTAHPALIYQTITRQAGSLAKGVLETVMNAVDAGAKVCRITTEASRIVIEDDGRGFQSRQNIETFFGVFGQPHQEGDATYGTFRLGRGQALAQGVNTWHTGRWRMVVDIKHRGLKYDLVEGAIDRPGCRIEIDLYERQLPVQLLQLQRDLERWCKWIHIPVELNGKVISKDPATAKWDRETDDAYFSVKKTGSVSVYNLGVHVMEVPEYKFGTGGEVVSKKQLRLNVARTDIMSDCPVWRSAQRVVRELAGTAIERAPQMTEGARQHLADQVSSGMLKGDGVWEAKIITTVQGRNVSVGTWARQAKFTVARSGDHSAERAMDHKVCFAVAQETLDRLGVNTGPEMVALLKKATAGQYPHMYWPEYVAYDEATKAFQGKYEVLDTKKLGANTRAWLTLAQRLHNYVRTTQYVYGESSEQTHPRDILIGRSGGVADGWTDGDQYICIDEDFLRRLPWNVRGFTELGTLLAHEYSHDGDNGNGCSHDGDFYEGFYRRCRGLPAFVEACLGWAPEALKRAGKDLNKQLAKAMGGEVLVAEAAKGLTILAAKAGQDAPLVPTRAQEPPIVPPVPVAAPVAAEALVPARVARSRVLCPKCGKIVARQGDGLAGHPCPTGK